MTEAESLILYNLCAKTFMHTENDEACQVMTNADHEELIFLSHPQTNNGLFFLLTT